MAKGEPLEHDEAVALLRACGTSWAGVRDRAYIAVLYRCGLRNNEARMLDFSDLHRTEQGSGKVWQIRVRHQKGKTSHRVLGVDRGCQAMLEQWIELRGEDPGPLFRTKQGNRIDTSHLRQKLPKLAAIAGIQRRVHPHCLRHTFARGLSDRGINMRIIQLALGHSKLNTTQEYLHHLGDADVVEVTGEGEWT